MPRTFTQTRYARPRTFLPALAAALAAFAAGCGGPSPRQDLERTAARLGTIDSARVAFSFVISPARGIDADPYGFRLRGRVAYADGPTADVVYTQITGGGARSAHLVLLPDGGYSVVDGRRHPFTPAELRRRRAAANAAHSIGNLVDVDGSVDSAHRCGDRCVAGELDRGAAVSAFLEFGAGGLDLSSTARRRLADATTATYRVRWRDDHLVRTLRIDATIGAGGSQQLRHDLGTYAGARVAVRLTVAPAGERPVR
jgi:hypothetical protein